MFLSSAVTRKPKTKQSEMRSHERTELPSLTNNTTNTSKTQNTPNTSKTKNTPNTSKTPNTPDIEDVADQEDFDDAETWPDLMEGDIAISEVKLLSVCVYPEF